MGCRDWKPDPIGNNLQQEGKSLLPKCRLMPIQSCFQSLHDFVTLYDTARIGAVRNSVVSDMYMEWYRDQLFHIFQCLGRSNISRCQLASVMSNVESVFLFAARDQIKR